MKKQHLVTLATGSVLAAAVLAPAHAAQGNPFEVHTMTSGYQVAEAGDKKKDASCGADKKAAPMPTTDKKQDAGCGATKK